MIRYVTAIAFVACLPLRAPAETAGSRVAFNEEDIAPVEGKPFSPIGMFTYNIDSNQPTTICHGAVHNNAAARRLLGIAIDLVVGRELSQTH